MLVLSRGLEDKILFPNLDISIEILRIAGNKVRVGINAPKEVRVLRHELAEAMDEGVHSGGSPQASRSEQIHELRNRLNTAQLALGLTEKQLNAGMNEKALLTLHRAISDLAKIERETSGDLPAVEAPHKTGQPRALLVDDNANESELLAGYLEMSGFDVDTAGDGIQAMVQLARCDRPDVILLDMHMPNMDGSQTINTIRANPDFEGVKVFAVTGTSPSEMNVIVGPGGVDRWFVKPIKPQELVDELQRNLVCA